MSTAHKASLLPTANTVRIAPSNTLALFHFDGHVNDLTRGLYPTGTPVYTLRPDGKFGGCIAIDEGTTNLIPLARQDFTGWNVYGGSIVTLTQGQTIPGITNGGATRIQTTGGSGADAYLKYFYSFGVGTAGTPFSTSVWIYNCGTNPVRVTGNELPSGPIVQPGQVVYSTASKASISGSGDRQLRFSTVTNATDALDFIVWNPQGEQKAFPTSFTSGSRAAGMFKLEPTLFKVPLTISFWAKGVAGGIQTLFDFANLYRGSYIQWNGNNVEYSVWNSSGSLTYTSPVTIDQWHLYTIVYDTTETRCHLDGNYLSTMARASGIDRTIFSWGVSPDGSYISKSTFFDELIMLPFAASSDEILSWYNSGAPFHDPQDKYGVVL